MGGGLGGGRSKDSGWKWGEGTCSQRQVWLPGENQALEGHGGMLRLWRSGAEAPG